MLYTLVVASPNTGYLVPPGEIELNKYLLNQIILLYSQLRLNALKYFLKIAWELKAIDNKKYALLSTAINEVGKMLGGWKKQAQNVFK
ncbi:MAG: four helix bundle protein [bacterium]|nr:four helix bundle protein [bacterium]